MMIVRMYAKDNPTRLTLNYPESDPEAQKIRANIAWANVLIGKAKEKMYAPFMPGEKMLAILRNLPGKKVGLRPGPPRQIPKLKVPLSKPKVT